MMEQRIAIGALLLVLVVAVVVMGYVDLGTFDDQGDAAVAVPRPPPSPPIRGDRLTPEEADERSPYTIPFPDPAVADGNPDEIWVSREGTQPKSHQVYLIYPNGLRISIGARTDAVDHSVAAGETGRQVSVLGKPASGRDPYMKTTTDGQRVPIVANLTWWVNRVEIALYHPTLSMDELVEIAETMSDPVWKPN